MLAAALVVLWAPRPASAEWQVKPFLGAAYGGNTTFLTYVPVPGVEQRNHGHTAFGVSGLWLSEIFGLEGDVGHTSGFFEGSDAPLVIDSGVTTATGNVVVAMPRRLAQYTLRPYLVGGAGVMHIRFDTVGGLQALSNLQAMDLGAGVTGFLTRRVGLSWDVRYFRSIDRTREQGSSFGSEHLSFWRVNMAVAIRL